MGTSSSTGITWKMGVAALASAPEVGLLEGWRSGVPATRCLVDPSSGRILEAVGQVALLPPAESIGADGRWQRLAARRSERIDVHRVRPSRRRVRNGMSLLVSQLLAGNSSIVHGGAGFVSTVTLGGHTWLTELSICPRPECQCGEVGLTLECLGCRGGTYMLHVDSGRLDLVDLRSDDSVRLLRAARRFAEEHLDFARQAYWDTKAVAARSLGGRPRRRAS